VIPSWEISHIGIAVDDLEAAMRLYGEALQVEWGPVVEFGAGCVLPSDVHAGGLDAEGLREVASVTRGSATPSGAVQLVHAREGSPAFPVWGCSSGRQHVHHVAYWVEDIGLEVRRLRDLGFGRELYLPDEESMQIACLVGDTGLRVELQSVELKEAAARFLATGELSGKLAVDLPGLVIHPPG
jgi:catechol 2,3-dioxygenase-like lactoylglutathione lyase family enzyme